VDSPEYVDTQMAEAAGITVGPAVALIPDEDLQHLAVRRFDRPTTSPSSRKVAGLRATR
jgi:hypothetical protein